MHSLTAVEMLRGPALVITHSWACCQRIEALKDKRFEFNRRRDFAVVSDLLGGLRRNPSPPTVFCQNFTVGDADVIQPQLRCL